MKIKGKKILIFLPHLTRGGAETQGVLLAKGLQQKGCSVEVCGFKHPDESLISTLKRENLNYFTLPMGMDVFQYRKESLKAFLIFRKILNQRKIDVIIPFTWWCNFLSAITFRFSHVKQCFWNQRSVDHHVRIRRMERFIPKHKLTFVSNSKVGREFLMERFQISEDNVRIINNGIKPLPVPSEDEYTHKTNLLDIDSTHFTLIMMANFFPEKDVETVIYGIDKIRKSMPKVKMIFLGNSKSIIGTKAKALCFDLKLENHVIFKDTVEDVGNFLKLADVGVLSSTSEGCPNSILEYIQSELPVLATNIEAISDVVGNDYPFLFGVKNSEEFAEKVEKLASSKELRESMVNRLKVKLENYSTEKMVENFNQLIK